MVKEFKVEFHGEGFDLEKDISEEFRNTILAEYMAMYNQYAEGVNSILENINSTWEQYEYARDLSKRLQDGLDKVMRDIMGLNEGDDYYDYCTKWFKQVAEAVNVDSDMSNFHVYGDIFRIKDEDGNNVPIYGARVKTHLDWKIWFTSEPVD